MAEIVELDDLEESPRGLTVARDSLAGWVTAHVNEWTTHRDTQYKQRWEEYYRLWRGIFHETDKTRNSERSKIITPALQQAVDSVTSEIESAILDRAEFFDVEDDVEDQERDDILTLRKRLRQDFKEAQVQHALAQIFLNGSLFGTGIGKLEVTEDVRLGLTGGDIPQLTEASKVLIKLHPVLPSQFAIDTAAHTIKDALGVAHCYDSPEHAVRAMQDRGSYWSGDVERAQPKDALESDENPDSTADAVNVIEYHGLVPKYLLDAARAEYDQLALEDDEEIVSLLSEDDTDDDHALVEAVVVIANETTVLRAVENPTLTKERLFVAYRHEIVPDQFWGRGVCEKGYNSQKALDASMRGRLDGLALTVHPMMSVDSTRMPRGFRFAVQPGRTILTTGDPKEVLNPVRFGDMDPNVFTNTSELERMVSMSTGGFDTAAPVNVNNRNETASGMSMMLGGFVKRSKRTIRNIEEELIVPMVQLVAKLYMQFNPERYPARDVTFKAVSVLGTMARELEQQQFANMLNTVPQDSPAFWMLLKSVYETSALSNREQVIPLIEAQLQQVLNPPPPPEDPLLELRRMEVTSKVRAENARIQVEYIRAQAEVARAANDARLAASKEAKEEADAILKLAKAAAEEVGNQYQQYTRQLEELERNAAGNQGLVEDVIKRASETGLGDNA